MPDYVSREEHDRDIDRLSDRIDKTRALLEDRFAHSLERLDDHLRSQDLWLRGILGTVLAWAILHVLGIA